MLRELDSEDSTTRTIRLVSTQVADCARWLTLWGFANPDSAPSSLRSRPHRDEHEFSAAEARSAIGDRYQRPDPEALLLNVLRIHAGRQALVDLGTYTVGEIATARNRPRKHRSPGSSASLRARCPLHRCGQRREAHACRIA